MAIVYSSIVSSQAPTPTQTPTSLADSLRKLIIVFSLNATFVFLLFLFFLGRMRRSVNGRRFLRNATKICYLLVPISITYIMGGLHKDPNPHALSPIWASILIYAYGGVITISACDLRDNDETLRYAWHILPLFFWTFWLGVIVCISNTVSPCVPVLVCTLVFFLVLAMINTQQTLRAFYCASKSKGLPRFVEPIISHMNTLGEEPNPRTMRGYKYIVHVNPRSEHETLTTIEEIWKWFPSRYEKQDEETSEASSLGIENKFLAKCVNNERLRDMCLSYALFGMLLTRFAGFPPICNKNPITSRRFVQEGLLLKEPQHDHMDRAFRVIEVELDYLFEFFYTKSHACGPYRFRDIWQHVVQILLLLVFGVFGIPLVADCAFSFPLVDGTEDMQVINTMVVILVFVLLESCKYIMVQFSNRKVVWLACTYIREASSNNKWASTTKWRIVLICTIKHFLTETCGLGLFYLFKPWQRKLGQYSFLDSYDQVPLLARKLFSPFGKVVKLPKRGQCGDSMVALSKEVKQVVVSSLVQNHGLKLMRGIDTLRRHGLHEISDTYQCLESDARFILVWHIATGFCESNHPIQSKAHLDHGHFLAAVQLSKYCAYLLTFAPKLLPDHPYSVECLFDEAVKQAQGFKRNGLGMHELYKKLISRVNINDTIVVRGAFLAHELAEYVIKRPCRGWKVLAEFWAEVLLYLAPTDDVGVHGEYLARGGEFITHLWALLTHAGVYTRGSSS